MPRKARLDAPGALHHIVGRGIERRNIYMDDTDRDRFITRLSSVLMETGTPCYAWALMPNHFHLLLKTGETPIATVMRRLLTGHAVYFNRRHDRHGQLFQNRYKSFLCQEDAYLLELVRYIHLNPLRSGIVEDMARLDEFPYCGHATLIAIAQNDWQDTAYVLRLFGPKVKTAVAAYRAYLAKGASQGRRRDLTGGGLVRSLGGWESVVDMRRSEIRIKGDERILGDSVFVQAVLDTAEEQLSQRYRRLSEGMTIEALAARIASLMGVPERTIWKTTRQRAAVKAKSLLCYRAHYELGVSMTELGRRLGLTQPAVSKAVRRGAIIAEERGQVKTENKL